MIRHRVARHQTRSVLLAAAAVNRSTEICRAPLRLSLLLSLRSPDVLAGLRAMAGGHAPVERRQVSAALLSSSLLFITSSRLWLVVVRNQEGTAARRAS
jgi:hypothetical protein